MGQMGTRKNVIHTATCTRDPETLFKGHGEDLATEPWFIFERETSRKALVEEVGRRDKGRG